ncbi:EAL domain-containing protein, partial [Pseudonocardia sp. EV170527-09]|uniref:EAL domain-containing protein n=1 Tax=Pseudonocardia sp. EV170527-09 TaxID=2603411 RepID=UPI0021055B84
MPPDKFIPLAERHHRIRKLTNRMLDLLVADAQEIPRDLARAMYFSVNLSAEDLAARAIAQRVADVRQACGVDGVMVEATEGVL